MTRQEVEIKIGTSLVVQWIRICLLMQGHGLDLRSRKIPCAAEQLSPSAIITESGAMTAEAMCLEPVLRNERSHCSGKSLHFNWQLLLSATRESLSTTTETQ